MAIKTGNISEIKTNKAGCGIRFDPEQLGDDTGFNFPDQDYWKRKNSPPKPSQCLKNTELGTNEDSKCV
jgi:hypothetical protein